MRKVLPILAVALTVVACSEAPVAQSEYLFVWAGDSAEKASDFLAVIDANPASAAYGSVITAIPTGATGTHPHHTEAEMPASGHLLANGFHSGQTWLFDLTAPREPRIISTFGDLAGYSHPHTYQRLSNGNVLATFQYRSDSSAPAPMMHMGGSAQRTVNAEHPTGGLVEMDEKGTVVRSGSAVDTTIKDRRLFPYSVLAMRGIDRAVSTTTDMDEADVKATSEWVQFWRLSDLTLLRSIALRPGPRGDENQFTGEPRLLPDGKSVYIHTFNCGLYLVRDIAAATPSAVFVKGFEGKECGVPILTGQVWLQPVPSTHSLVALDISDPEHPREVSSVKLDDGEAPHWIALDRTGTRVVLNSGGGGTRNRLYIIKLDPITGHLAIDDQFRDLGSATPGVTMSARKWPHGFTGTASPHGTVFSR